MSTHVRSSMYQTRRMNPSANKGLLLYSKMNQHYVSLRITSSMDHPNFIVSNKGESICIQGATSVFLDESTCVPLGIAINLPPLDI